MLQYFLLNKKKSAFSLIEVSIVIVIIGLLIIGVIGSKHLIAKSRLSTARSLTTSSPISSVRDNALWLESSLDELAFSDNPEASDGDSLSSWKDNSYNQNKSTITAVGTGPTYANTINHVQAVQFSASASNYLQIDNASFLNNTDYTIFVLEKREANSSANYFIGDGTDMTANQTLILGYSTDTAPIHSQGTGNNYVASLETYSSYSGKPRLFTFMSDSTDGKKMYINGVLAAEDADTTQLSGITTLPIGMSYNGEIGEIAIFTRALKAVERTAIEDYMGKKWDNQVNRDTVSGGSCTSGTITSTGCDASCSVSINGSSVTTLAADDSDNFVCDGTGYNSGSTTQEYTCTGGSLTPSTPATSQCVDDLGCATGYLEVSNACAQGCTTTDIIGSSSTTVAAGATSVTCDDTGYDSTFTFSACSAGDNVTGTCGTCADGYNLNGGVCEQKCDLLLGDSSLPADVSVDSGAVEYVCSTYGSYTGTITFDACDDGSTLTTVSGSCSVVAAPASCTGGTESTITVAEVDYNLHVFESSDDLICDGAISDVEYLVVAGGGGSGGFGGGGGAGGLLSGLTSLSDSTYTIVVGASGAGQTDHSAGGSNGGDSTIDELGLTAVGGGLGYHAWKGVNGGSGGGSGYGTTSSSNGESGQGFGGGGGYSGSPGYPGGGGGGAGSAGTNASSTSIAGDAGLGVQNDITGVDVWYAVGGPGATRSGTHGTPGTDGSSVGEDGDPYTGNGGGAGITMWVGKAGGSGIVIISYPSP